MVHIKKKKPLKKSFKKNKKYKQAFLQKLYLGTYYLQNTTLNVVDIKCMKKDSVLKKKKIIIIPHHHHEKYNGTNY